MRAALRPNGLTLALLFLAVVLAVVRLAPSVAHLLSASVEGYDPVRLVLLHSTLPRLAMAILCGAALGASGAILQQALRNPIASSTTLGIDAGARLALSLATLFAPAMIGIGRDLTALVGSGLAIGLVFLLTRRQGFGAVPLVLAGLVISLYCGALSAILVLTNDRYLVSLFIWGGGSLSQQRWGPTLDLALRLAFLAPIAWLLVRPLGLLDLGETSARALGLPVSVIRTSAVGVAVALAAFVVSTVGVIGFVGLIAPVLAGLSGARSFGRRLALAATLGALLLLVTDLAVQLLAGAAADLLPTGAVTAVLGSPLLLWLLPRLPKDARPPIAPAIVPPAAPGPRTLVVAGLTGLALVAAALFFGRTPSGSWAWLDPDLLETVLPLRAPRVLAAAASGAMLGVAGLVLQRLTGNEMASPEILGISAGATFAVAIALFVGTGITVPVQFGAAVAGSLVVLAVILAVARHGGFAPERVLLAGVALNALLDAVIGLLSATGDPRAVRLLSVLGGSTSGVSIETAAAAAFVGALIGGGGLLAARWLRLLPLGAGPAQALGVPVARARLSLILAAAAATAVATPLVGPLTFVGLMAPHIVRMIGIDRPVPALLSAALVGAGLLVAADWAARVAAYPFQLPTGLVAALVGAPFLLVLLQSRRHAT